MTNTKTVLGQATRMALFLLLLLGGLTGTAQEMIQPAGKFIAVDKDYRRVYQLHANGVAIAYKLVGSGEPLVMVMGLGGTMEDWTKDFINALSRRFQLILIDNRGMGYSTANDAKFSYRLFADDLVGFLDALGVEKANLFGFAMGSAITQEVLVDYPQRVNKAVLCGPCLYGKEMLDSVAGVNFNDSTVLRQVEAAKEWNTPLTVMPSVTDQVMVLVGGSDAEPEVDNSKAIATAIPGAWLIQFKKGRQPMTAQENTEFARVMATFFGN